MCLSNDQRHHGQVDEENQHLLEQVNELTAKITALESKLLDLKMCLSNDQRHHGQVDEENQHLLEQEMQGLLLVKMKELADSQEADSPLQTEPDSLKAVLKSISGWFVRLVNSSSELEEDIGGFILQQNVGGHSVAVYRFPPRTRMKADTTVTLWSAAENISHKPPEDVLWKEQNRFGTGPECTTIFCRPNGKASDFLYSIQFVIQVEFLSLLQVHCCFSNFPKLSQGKLHVYV
ncbi:UNVERIFIED_CONTAM: hypothetical protein FKN15_010998 [Acipenser sinensis]